MADSSSDSQTTEVSRLDPSMQERVEQRLDRWETLQAAGVAATPEELAGDDQAIVETLRERIEMLKAFSRFEQQSTTAPPSQVDGYRIVREIGKGANSIIYLAQQTFPGRMVALKLLCNVAARPRLEQRFRLEADVLASLQHPNIARIYDAGIANVWGAKRLYFTMEWIDGTNVQQHVTDRKTQSHDWTPEDTVRLCLHFADALSEAHSLGAVHRDLKPDNMLVMADGTPKLIDFGLAAVRSDSDVETGESTQDGFVGTRCYMSPEQFSGSPASIDTRTDIYGFGVVLYQLLTDRLPYPIEDKTVWETAEIVRHQPPTPIRRINRRCSHDLETILQTSLRKAPSERYQSMTEFADDLRRYLQGRPIRAKRIHIGAVVGKWCRRHRTAALTSALAVTVMLALLMATLVATAKVARQSTRLTQANRQLQSQQLELVGANQELETTVDRLTRKAFSKSLLRLSMLADQDRKHTYQQLLDQQLFPNQLRSFAWNILTQSVRPNRIDWVADTKGIYDIAICDDGDWCATSGPSAIRVWDCTTQELLAQYQTDDVDPSVPLSLLEDPQAVCFVCFDGGARRLSVDQDETTMVIPPSARRITALFTASARDLCLTLDQSGTLECRNLSENRLLWKRFILESQGIAIRADELGQRYAAVSRNGEIVIGLAESGEVTSRQNARTTKGSTPHWRRARISHDLNSVSLCQERSKALVWDVIRKEPRRSFDHLEAAPDIAFVEAGATRSEPAYLVSGRNRIVKWSGTSEGAIVYSDKPVAAGDKTDQSTTNGGAIRAATPVAVAVAREQDRVAIAMSDGRLLIDSIYGNHLFQRWPTARSTVAGLALSTDGKRLAAYAGGGSISIHDTRNGKILWEANGNRRRTHDIHFAGNDQWIIARRHKHLVSAFNAASGNLVSEVIVPSASRRMLKVRDRFLLGIAADQLAFLTLKSASKGISFGPVPHGINGPIQIARQDSNTGRIALSHDDGIVTVGQITQGDRFQLLAEQWLGHVRAMTWLPGQHRLVTGDQDGSVVLWGTPPPDAGPRGGRRSMEEISRTRPNSYPVGSLAVSPDGTTMASGAFNGDVIFWDTVTMEPQLVVSTELIPIRDMAFSSDGRTLVIGGKGDHMAVFRTSDAGRP